MPHSIYVKKQFEAKLILMDNNLEPFFLEMVMYFSMTQLLLHTFAHLTGPSFRAKAKLLPNNFVLDLV